MYIWLSYLDKLWHIHFILHCANYFYNFSCYRITNHSFHNVCTWLNQISNKWNDIVCNLLGLSKYHLVIRDKWNRLGIISYGGLKSFALFNQFFKCCLFLSQLEYIIFEWLKYYSHEICCFWC